MLKLEMGVYQLNKNSELDIHKFLLKKESGSVKIFKIKKE